MKLGIIVEGPYDAETYPILIRRIRADVAEVYPREYGGITKLKSSFVGQLKGFQWHMGPVDKALVIRDSDYRDATQQEKDLADILRRSGFVPPFPVHFYAVKCELETWLLADEPGTNRVALARGRTKVLAPLRRNLEELQDPYQLLLARLSEVGLPADPQVYAEIARESDLNVIEHRCPYFQQFRHHVMGC